MATITSNNVTHFLTSLTTQIHNAIWEANSTILIELINGAKKDVNEQFLISGIGYSVLSKTENQIELKNNTFGDIFTMKGTNLDSPSLGSIDSVTVSGAGGYDETMLFSNLTLALTSNWLGSFHEMTDTYYDSIEKSKYTYHILKSGEINFSNNGLTYSETLTESDKSLIYKNGKYQKFTLTSQDGLYIDTTKSTGIINTLSYKTNNEGLIAKNINLTAILPNLLKYSIAHYDETDLEDQISANFNSNMISLLLKGNDTIKGTTGNDLLMGGLGKDKLTGGAGNDTFIYQSLRDSSILTTKMDTITDFINGTDKIDLSALDANTATKSTNNAFTGFIDASTTFTTAGQLKWVDGILYGNTDKDASAEFAIALTGVSTLTMSDIIA